MERVRPGSWVGAGGGVSAGWYGDGGPRGQHRRHPPNGPCHLSRMGWWGVTWPAQQHERGENVVHTGNPGWVACNALDSRQLTAREGAHLAETPPSGFFSRPPQRPAAPSSFRPPAPPGPPAGIKMYVLSNFISLVFFYIGVVSLARVLWGDSPTEMVWGLRAASLRVVAPVGSLRCLRVRFWWSMSGVNPGRPAR